MGLLIWELSVLTLDLAARSWWWAACLHWLSYPPPLPPPSLSLSVWSVTWVTNWQKASACRSEGVVWCGAVAVNQVMTTRVVYCLVGRKRQGEDKVKRFSSRSGFDGPVETKDRLALKSWCNQRLFSKPRANKAWPYNLYLVVIDRPRGVTYQSEFIARDRGWPRPPLSSVPALFTSVLKCALTSVREVWYRLRWKGLSHHTWYVLYFYF